MIDGITLALDGSTYAGSVAVIRGDEVLAEAALPEADKPGRGGRDEQFMPMLASCMMQAGITPAHLARVVCGSGPGSFTSLRVAGSIAKGIAVGTGKPLYAVSSLKLVVAANEREPGRWLAALPAMRGEVFVSLFEVGEDGIRELDAPRIIAEGSLAEEAERQSANVVGPFGKNPQGPHALGVARVIESVVADGECDIATWEPVYGRLAEAQVRWEAAHGRPLSAAG